MKILKKINNTVTRHYDYYERYWFGGLLEPTIVWFLIISIIVYIFTV
jgi:hypothetical protein